MALTVQEKSDWEGPLRGDVFPSDAIFVYSRSPQLGEDDDFLKVTEPKQGPLSLDS